MLVMVVPSFQQPLAHVHTLQARQPPSVRRRMHEIGPHTLHDTADQYQDSPPMLDPVTSSQYCAVVRGTQSS
jgi:hypothetical protein